ncbi:putative leader peptide [Streptomyces sp. NPDC058290]|uniref:putative leader peptide n=1 Tax=Streptomyces sp. NPDC058290 TaxID=3346426 RepID=UPI0036E77849
MKDAAGQCPVGGVEAGFTVKECVEQGSCAPCALLAAENLHVIRPAISYGNSREVLTSVRRAPQDVPMSPSQPLLVRRRHVDLRRVASAVCRPV